MVYTLTTTYCMRPSYSHSVIALPARVSQCLAAEKASDKVPLATIHY